MEYNFLDSSSYAIKTEFYLDVNVNNVFVRREFFGTTAPLHQGSNQVLSWELFILNHDNIVCSGSISSHTLNNLVLPRNTFPFFLPD